MIATTIIDDSNDAFMFLFFQRTVLIGFEKVIKF